MEKEITYTAIAERIAEMRKRRGIIVKESNYCEGQKIYESLHRTIG